MLNDDMTHGTEINKIIEKQKLWKEWKQGNKNKQQYLEEKQKARKVVYQTRYKAQRKRLRNLMQ